MVVKVRTATSSDSNAIADVHLKVSKQMLEGIVSTKWIQGMDRTYQKRQEYWTQVICNHLDDPIAVLVAESESAGIIGFASLLDRGKNEAELDCLYVLGEYQSQRVGKDILNMAFDILKNKRCGRLLCHVLEQNIRARQFYCRMGARETQTSRTAQFGKESANEIELVWQLDI